MDRFISIGAHGFCIGTKKTLGEYFRRQFFEIFVFDKNQRIQSDPGLPGNHLQRYALFKPFGFQVSTKRDRIVFHVHMLTPPVLFIY